MATAQSTISPEMARLSPATFAQYLHPERIVPAHVVYMSRKIRDAIMAGDGRIIVTMPPRHAKALAVDTPVWTPGGWIAHGDLRSGDQVFTPSGVLTTVEAVTPHMLAASSIVHFSGGSSLVASDEHKWDVWIDRDCRNPLCGEARGHRHQELRETRGLLSGYNRRPPSIPVADPLSGREQASAVDPYMLGVWLGDGNARSGSITVSRQDLDHLFEEFGECLVKPDGGGHYRVTPNGLYRYLRLEGLLGRKRVEAFWFRSAIHDRLSLLQGLMDSDGTIAPTGQASFTNTNRNLSESVRQLAISLGYIASIHERRAKLNGKDCGPMWVVGFTPELSRPPFRLPRKAERIRVSTTYRAKHRWIQSVEPIGERAVNCIQVTGGRYLAGEELIATHNSDTISIHTPAWYLDIWPEKNVMLASYSEIKAVEWGRKVKNLIVENPQKFMVTLSADSKAAGRWNTPEGGGMLCSGIGGPLTGSPGDLIVVDDPIKNEEEASSETRREKVFYWFQSVVETRAEPGSTIVIVTTRWNEDDLVGRLLYHQRQAEEEGLPQLKWTLINFPCVAEENDELGRVPGEALWPERGFDDAWIARKKTAVGSRVWSALYQQRPSPMGGAIFKREHFRYFQRDGDTIMLARPGMGPKFYLISDLRYFQCADTAQKIRTLNDWTACITVGVTKDRDVLIFDSSRARLEVPDQLPYLDRLWARWPQVSWQGIEDNASGTGLLQAAARLGRPRRPLSAVVDKVKRASSAAIWYENGMVYHASEASWLDDFEGELLSFPNGRFDDQVDCLSYAVIEMSTSAGLPFPAEARGPSLDDEEDRYREDADHPDHAEWERERHLGDIMPKGNPFR